MKREKSNPSISVSGVSTMDVCENVIAIEDIESNEQITIDDATTRNNMVSPDPE